MSATVWNPATIAQPLAFELIKTEIAEAYVEEVGDHILSAVEFKADQEGWLEQPYYVEAGRAIALPMATLAEGSGQVADGISGIKVEGKLRCYGFLEIGEMIGSLSVNRSLCLVFDDAFTVAPYLAKTPDDWLTFIPALAISDIKKLN